MADPTSTFFDAWKIEESGARLKMITSAVSESIQYDDPRTPNTVTSISALNEYVGMFSANAPGWSANVVGSDTTAGMVRATVAFGGKGPDGKDMTQLGQYFVEIEGDVITRMVGFVGTGVTE